MEAPLKYILIDGGPYFNFEIQLKAMMKIAPDMKELELLVITHVDIDHIDGTILLLQQKNLPFTIKDVWFNGLQQMRQADDDLLGVIQGEYVSVLSKKTNSSKPAFSIWPGDGARLCQPTTDRIGWRNEINLIRTQSRWLKRHEGKMG